MDLSATLFNNIKDGILVNESVELLVRGQAYLMIGKLASILPEIFAFAMNSKDRISMTSVFQIFIHLLDNNPREVLRKYLDLQIGTLLLRAIPIVETAPSFLSSMYGLFGPYPDLFLEFIHKGGLKAAFMVTNYDEKEVATIMRRYQLFPLAIESGAARFFLRNMNQCGGMLLRLIFFAVEDIVKDGIMKMVNAMDVPSVTLLHCLWVVTIRARSRKLLSAEDTALILTSCSQWKPSLQAEVSQELITAIQFNLENHLDNPDGMLCII